MRISDWSSDVCSSDLIARLERGADSPANWLCSIGLDTARDKAEPVSDGGQRCGKTFSGVRTANLGGWSDRDVEHDMGSTRRNLLRQDRSDQLRSEEHTSELQSLMRISYAVFCLKKKKKKKK